MEVGGRVSREISTIPVVYNARPSLSRLIDHYQARHREGQLALQEVTIFNFITKIRSDRLAEQAAQQAKEAQRKIDEALAAEAAAKKEADEAQRIKQEERDKRAAEKKKKKAVEAKRKAEEKDAATRVERKALMKKDEDKRMRAIETICNKSRDRTQRLHEIGEHETGVWSEETATATQEALKNRLAGAPVDVAFYHFPSGHASDYHDQLANFGHKLKISAKYFSIWPTMRAVYVAADDFAAAMACLHSANLHVDGIFTAASLESPTWINSNVQQQHFLRQAGKDLHGGAVFYILRVYVHALDAVNHNARLQEAKYGQASPDRPLFATATTSALSFASALAIHYPTDLHYPVAEAFATFIHHWTTPGSSVYGFDMQLRGAPAFATMWRKRSYFSLSYDGTPQHVMDAQRLALEAFSIMLQQPVADMAFAGFCPEAHFHTAVRMAFVVYGQPEVMTLHKLLANHAQPTSVRMLFVKSPDDERLQNAAAITMLEVVLEPELTDQIQGRPHFGVITACSVQKGDVLCYVHGTFVHGGVPGANASLQLLEGEEEKQRHYPTSYPALRVSQYSLDRETEQLRSLQEHGLKFHMNEDNPAVYINQPLDDSQPANVEFVDMFFGDPSTPTQTLQLAILAKVAMPKGSRVYINYDRLERNGDRSDDAASVSTPSPTKTKMANFQRELKVHQ